MHSSIAIKSLLFTLIIMTKSISFAIGGMEGGGGKSIVCRSSNGVIQSAEVLDLYEGRIQYGLNYTESSTIADDQVLKIFENSKLGTGHSMPPTGVYDRYLNLKKYMRFVPIGTVLNPIDDSLEVIAPTNCKIEQTINYINDQTILVSTEIWNAFSETQKTAILIHESVYRFLRNYGETDSRRARHFTAFLLSGGQIDEIYPGNGYYALCSNTDRGQPVTDFYISNPIKNNDGQDIVRLYFSHIAGRTLLSNSYIEINNNSSYSDLNVPTFLEILKDSSLLGDGCSFTYEYLTTKSNFEGGDIIDLTLSGTSHNTTPAKMSITGITSIDNKSFESSFKCFFPTH